MVDGGGEMKMEPIRQPEDAAPELEPLSELSSEDMEKLIGPLKYDALEDSTPEDRHEQKIVLGEQKLYHRFHAPGKHGELFVLRAPDGSIEGLIGVHADAPNQTGHITLLRTETREKAQFGITQKLLTAAEHYLRRSPRSCTRAVIKALSPSEYLRMAARVGPRQRFYEFQEAANDNDSKNVHEKAA